LVFCFALFSLLVSGPGCSRSASTPEKAAAQMLAWNLKTTVDAYNKAGTKSLIWDDAAQRCLTAFAHLRAQDRTNESWGEVVSTNASAAMDVGCTDPLITYLYIRFAMPQTNSKVEFFKRFAAMADAMNASAYPPVRKFYATARAMDQLYYTYDTTTNLQARDQAFGLMNSLLGNVGETMSDKTIPSQEASEIAEQALHLSNADFHNQTMFYDAIEQGLMKNFSGDYLPWYLKGNHYIGLAWNARTSETADKVTAEGWEGFKTNLVIAREALEHAWKLNPKQPNIAIQMMTVDLGQGNDRQEMELWFHRAMDLNTNCYEACRNKMNFLDPKWYGSDEDQLAFGRECASSTKWGGHVPLMLVLAHNDIDFRLPGAARADYWKQSEVWSDMKTAYDRFFELNPGETYLYSDYALHAYQAEQWETLNEILPKLTYTNLETFGSKAEFDKMIRLAKAHTSN
jgi:hypothetical protein